MPSIALARLWAALALLALAAPRSAANFLEADFVPTTRRAQFQQHRTHWHDVLGAHCPKFGRGRAVAVPLPQPVGYAAGDEYRLQLAFDGGRVVTPWLLLSGRRAPVPPGVEVTLTRAGDALTRAAARVVPAAELGAGGERGAAAAARRAAPALAVEWGGAGAGGNGSWPRHVLVHYRWHTQHEANPVAGLAVLFGGCGAAAVAGAAGVLRAHRRRLREFLADVGGGGGPGEKAE